ncbi:MAG: endonuclease/exonuclease/phosphatase family protein [Muribaculaceae bacterium]|nr:endonuclease/exonuclease/phosphatase family protein [Muribaculaceae bacterium]
MTENHPSPKRSRKVMPRIAVIFKWLWLAMTIAVAATTVISANSGLINPLDITWPSMLAMAFPFLIVADVVLGLINLFINKWIAGVQWIALICSVTAIGNWFPVHPFAREAADVDNDNVIKFMSYNTFGFADAQNCFPDSTNRTATSIINSGADIICLQEVGQLVDMPTRGLTDEQIDSINEVYPYFASEEEKMVSILSKYPLREVYLDQPVSPHSGWQAAEVTIGNDTILVVSVHLQSFGLDAEDKILYHRITDGSVSGNMADAGLIIYHKLSDAFELRAAQAEKLRHQLDSLNYRNVILSGDFNDIAGCYPMRTIAGDDMKSVFRTIATGPVITYHSDRFFFNIDHVLYQGDITPVRYRRGSIKSSDHYPIYVTFRRDRHDR